MSLWIACSDWEILQSATRLRHSGLGVAPDSASFMEHEDRTGAYGQSRTGARTEQDWSKDRAAGLEHKGAHGRFEEETWPLRVCELCGQAMGSDQPI